MLGTLSVRRVWETKTYSVYRWVFRTKRNGRSQDGTTHDVLGQEFRWIKAKLMKSWGVLIWCHCFNTVSQLVNRTEVLLMDCCMIITLIKAPKERHTQTDPQSVQCKGHIKICNGKLSALLPISLLMCVLVLWHLSQLELWINITNSQMPSTCIRISHKCFSECESSYKQRHISTTHFTK